MSMSPEHEITVLDIEHAASIDPKLWRSLSGAGVDHHKFGPGQILSVTKDPNGSTKIKIRYIVNNSIFSYDIPKFLVQIKSVNNLSKIGTDHFHRSFAIYGELEREEFERQAIEQKRLAIEQARIAELRRIEDEKRAEIQRAELRRWQEEYQHLGDKRFINDCKRLVQAHRDRISIIRKTYLGVKHSIRELSERGCWGCRNELSNSYDLVCIRCNWVICNCSTCGCGHPTYDDYDRKHNLK